MQHVSIPMPPDGHATARTFFSTALGLEEKPAPVSLGSGVIWFQAGSNGQELHVYEDERWSGAPTGQHLCMEVDDLVEFRRRLETHGMAIEEAVPIRNRPRCFVRDPFGNLIEITQILGDYAS
ncbi:MAG: VOC family protein [Chloroflexota bacterium]|nr:VOC family protein [Chloroflexota bacterium]